jgi:hypothetical protein
MRYGSSSASSPIAGGGRGKLGSQDYGYDSRNRETQLQSQMEKEMDLDYTPPPGTGLAQNHSANNSPGRVKSDDVGGGAGGGGRRGSFYGHLQAVSGSGSGGGAGAGWRGSRISMIGPSGAVSEMGDESWASYGDRTQGQGQGQGQGGRRGRYTGGVAN